jgi:hypothetical protein
MLLGNRKRVLENHKKLISAAHDQSPVCNQPVISDLDYVRHTVLLNYCLKNPRRVKRFLDEIDELVNERRTLLRGHQPDFAAKPGFLFK